MAFLTKYKLQGTSSGHRSIIEYIMRNRGNNEVSPTKELLLLLKNGRISWEEHAQNYLIDLRGSDDALQWMFETAMDAKDHEVILVCFEKDTKHCHRTLLAQEIVRKFPYVEYKGNSVSPDFLLARRNVERIF